MGAFFKIGISALNAPPCKTTATTALLDAVEHLTQEARRDEHVVGDVEAYLRPLIDFDSAREQWQAAKHTMRRYTTWKSAYFLAGSVAVTGGPNYHRLQRAFELPSALGRKLLRFDELTEWKNNHSDPNVSYPQKGFYMRESLADGVTQLLTGTRYEPFASWLISRDREYSLLLQSTMREETSVAEYRDWLKSAHAQAVRHALKLSIGASVLTRRGQRTPDTQAH